MEVICYLLEEEGDLYMHYLNQRRILSLDIMRGIAIFGIFLVNMLSFHSPLLYIDPYSWWENPIDQAIYSLIDIFAQGSFYPLFSLLFGYGFMILRERTLQKGVSFLSLASRRLFCLMAIGIFHAVLIWHGDILINYAFLGFFVLMFMGWTAKGMVFTGGLLWFIPNLLLSLLLFASASFVPANESALYNKAEAEQSVHIYQQGSILDIMEQRFEDWYLVNNPMNSIFMLFSILPFFLIGAGAAKWKLIERAKELKKPFGLAFFLFLILGLFIKLTPYVYGHNVWISYIQDAIGGPMLTIAYVLGIVLAAETKIGTKLFTSFAPVGKISMSNYLLQSILSTLIFYSYGLGFYNKISVVTGTILVILIYLLQIVLSHYWLKNHIYGPVEWLWRTITYKKIQPWKRT